MGRALCIACGVSLSMVGAAKVWAMPEWWSAATCVPPIVGLAVGAALAWRERWTLIQAAAASDEHFDTGDALRSAIELHDQGSDPFVSIAIERGEAAASKVVASRVVPSVRHGSWLIWPPVAATSVMVWMFAPAVTRETPKPTATAEHLAEAVKDLRQAAAAIAPREVAIASPSVPTLSQANELKALEEELSAGKIDPTTARTRAAEALNEAADRETERLADAQRAADAARARLAQAARSPRAAGESNTTGELREALSKGDVQAAAEAVERLRSQAPRLTPEERAKLAEDLEDLALAVEKQERPPESREEKGDVPNASIPDGAKPEAKTSPSLQTDRTPEQQVRESLRNASRALRAPEKREAPNAMPPHHASDTPKNDAVPRKQPKNRLPSSTSDSTQRPTPKEPEPASRNDEIAPSQGHENTQGQSSRENHSEPQQKPSPSDTPAKPNASKPDEKSSGEKTARPTSPSSPKKPIAPNDSTPGSKSPDAEPKKEGDRRETTSPEGSRTEASKDGEQQNTKPSNDAAPGSKPESPKEGHTRPDGGTPPPPASSPTRPTPAPQQGLSPDEKHASPPTSDAKGTSGNQPTPAKPPSDSSSPDEQPQPHERRKGTSPDERTGDLKPTSTPRQEPELTRESSPRNGGEPKPDQPADTRSSPEKQTENRTNDRPTNRPGQLPPLPKMSDEALEQVAKRLRDLGKNLEKNPPSQQQIDRWRKQAEDLLEKSTPEQREQLQRLAEKLAKDMPEPPSEDHHAPPPRSSAPNESRDTGNGPKPEQSPSGERDASPSPGTPQRSPNSHDSAHSENPSSTDKPPIAPGTDSPRNATTPTTTHATPPRIGTPDGTNSDAGNAAAPRRIGPTPQPWTGSTETVDARPKSVPEGSKPRVLAEVLNPDKTTRRSTSSEPSLGNELREAAKGAERAIEQQDVPNARTEFIRRVMRRYADRASSDNRVAPTDPAKPAPTPDAADASKSPKK